MVLSKARMRLVVLLSCLLSLARADDVFAIPETSKTSHYVTVRVTTEAIDDAGKQKLAITLDIKAMYYLIGARVPAEFEPSRLTVEVSVKGKKVEAEMTFPVGTSKDFAGLAKFETYQGRVLITGTIRRVPGDAGPVEVRIGMQGFPVSGA